MHAALLSISGRLPLQNLSRSGALCLQREQYEVPFTAIMKIIRPNGPLHKFVSLNRRLSVRIELVEAAKESHKVQNGPPPLASLAVYPFTRGTKNLRRLRRSALCL